MIQALSKWETKNWTLNIYGTGPDRHYLENLAAFLGLKDQVIFHGTTRDIRKVWEQNHLLLMPSNMEGMPLAVVEAMLCGRLCLATNVGGHKEWITDEENGYIAEAPAVDALLNTLQRAIKQKDKWPEMAHRAHEKASLLYNPNAGETLLNRIIAE
jgi:glycosyltransferase involved in cell wall biosynthesis